MKKIIVEVTKTGEIKLETRGYVGAACQNASRFLERALGKVVSDSPNGDMFIEQPLTTEGGAS